MATPEEQKLQVYNEALVHASTCRLPECVEHKGRCQKIRSSIHHFLNCYTKRRTTSRIDEIEECIHCAKIFRLLCFHASHCSGSTCVVHMCNYLRRKIDSAQQKSTSARPVIRQDPASAANAWPVDRRIAEAENNRAVVTNMIAQLVRAKQRNGEDIHGIYQKYL
ncbi:hypothetical protein H310_03240 [Aphanomyces invadans]|uniref:histone acetyltransferase n=1 Tax=Aphanomyces invadans TaxID=157072 RepID=A0A024UHZ6_9STRA|nr:hypothetical protein H310_03240 [Aphanomyces invadans]ETW05477.1 hypothetical protein H310_03240 [Aphanomyces invadans]|eukprot:XP_008865254.1 hypothetical protein H310_03240 [Aphanomyces invadans]